ASPESWTTHALIQLLVHREPARACMPSPLTTSSFLFFSVLRRTPFSPLFPYTTLFRSHIWARALPFAGSRRASFRRRKNPRSPRSEEHTSELQSHLNLVSRLLLEKKYSTTNSCPCRSTTPMPTAFVSSSTRLAFCAPDF